MMQAKDHLDLNIIILPDKHVQDISISWSKKVAEEYDTEFILDGVNYIPHISIYQTRYPAQNLEAITKIIRDIANSTNSFPIQLNTINTFLGFIFLDCVKSQELLQLHKKILEKLNPLREGLIIDEHRQMLMDPDVSAQRKESIRQYGYPLSNEAFSPHITISKLINIQNVQKASDRINTTGLTFNASEMALAYVDHDGTCKKIIEKFSFT